MYLESSTEKIFYRPWPVQKPVALLVIAHGLGEHSARYAHIAAFFNQQSISVYAIDHRGHGGSGGRRGHVADAKQYTADLHQLISQLRREHPDLPIHLLGHSMGGLIATDYALRNEKFIASLVLSSPFYGPKGLANKFSLLLAPLLAQLAPGLSVSNGLDAMAISRDTQVVEAYLEDPLVHDRVTLSWAGAIGKLQRFVAREISHLAIPTLMLVAGSDSLTDAGKAISFFERINIKHKQLKIYPDAFHEILNEPEQGEALQAIQNWFESLEL